MIPTEDNFLCAILQIGYMDLYRMFLSNTIQTLTDAINTLKSDIGEAQVQMKRAGEDRELQNKEFQGIVSDQRATQALLQKALTVLQGFYGKKAAAFVQAQQPAGPPPPPGFKAHKKNAASGGVMGMIQSIIDDAKEDGSRASRRVNCGPLRPSYAPTSARSAVRHFGSATTSLNNCSKSTTSATVLSTSHNC